MTYVYIIPRTFTSPVTSLIKNVLSARRMYGGREGERHTGCAVRDFQGLTTTSTMSMSVLILRPTTLPVNNHLDSLEIILTFQIRHP